MKSIIKNHIYILLPISMLLIKCSQSNKDLTGTDIRLFKDSPVWDLAKAVESEKVKEIKEIISKHRAYANYQEPKYGESLLLWAVWTNHYRSVKTLLENGANPNLPDYDDGKTAFIFGAEKFDTSRYLRLLINYGGDPNYIAKNDSTSMSCTPLIAAAYHRLESVKLLLDAGADINYTDKNYRCALSAGFTFKKIDVVRYLLIEKGVDFKKSFGNTTQGKPIMITDLLRRWVFPLNSKNYKEKMQIVDFLKARGMDYNKAHIPTYYYKNYSKEYLEKY